MKPPGNKMVELTTTMNDCIKIKYEASIRNHLNRVHHDNLICLDIHNNRLIHMLGSNMACRIADHNGNSNHGYIRDVQYRNGSAAVIFQPAIHQ